MSRSPFPYPNTHTSTYTQTHILKHFVLRGFTVHWSMFICYWFPKGVSNGICPHCVFAHALILAPQTNTIMSPFPYTHIIHPLCIIFFYELDDKEVRWHQHLTPLFPFPSSFFFIFIFLNFFSRFFIPFNIYFLLNSHVTSYQNVSAYFLCLFPILNTYLPLV